MIRFFLILFLLTWGCKAPQVITDTVVKDSVIVREVPKYIDIPGQTISSPSVNLDSLVKVIQSGVKAETINRTLTYTDPDTQLQVGLLIDQIGNITAVCEQQEQTIQVLQREIERYRTESTSTETIREPSFWEKLKGSLEIIVITIIITVVIMVIIRFRP